MSTQVTTGRARFSYCNVVEARRNDMNGKDEFSTQVLVQKSDTETIAALKAAAKEALTAKFGDKIPKTVRNPMRDGDTETKSDGSPLGAEYAGCWYFSTKSSKKPGIIDANGRDLISSDAVASGDFGRVAVNAYAYDAAGNKGVAFGLNHVMLIEKGTPLGGGKVSAATAFGLATPAASMSFDEAAAAPATDDEW
jgi:hypothetical protein